MKFVRDVRIVEKALGEGVKRVLESEVPIREKLRGSENATSVTTVEESAIEMDEVSSTRSGGPTAVKVN